MVRSAAEVHNGVAELVRKILCDDDTRQCEIIDDQVTVPRLIEVEGERTLRTPGKTNDGCRIVRLFSHPQQLGLERGCELEHVHLA